MSKALQHTAQSPPNSEFRNPERRATEGVRNPRALWQNENSLTPARFQSPKENAKAALRADDAFRENLIKLIPYLRAYARTLCRSRDDADDLAQEAIANAWQARAAFQPGTNLRAWLTVVQRNAFYSAHRRNWREVDWNEAAMEPILVTEGAQHASAELTDLKRAMASLPQEQREALILVGAAGFTHQEAAAIYRCPIGTMKSRVSRARHAIVPLMDEGTHLRKSSESESRPNLEIVAESDMPQSP